MGLIHNCKAINFKFMSPVCKPAARANCKFHVAKAFGDPVVIYHLNMFLPSKE